MTRTVMGTTTEEVLSIHNTVMKLYSCVVVIETKAKAEDSGGLRKDMGSRR